MDKNVTAKVFRDIVGNEGVMTEEPMADHTSFKVGGPADILVIPTGLEQLEKVLEHCRNEVLPFMVIGNGTNLIVRDKGIRGVVIKLYDNFNGIEVKGDVIEAQAGALLSRIANVALDKELAGLEFASGIPGTLGGAVTMNAGAYGGEMKDVVIETDYMDKNGGINTLIGEQHEFGYRTSFIQKTGGIVLRSRMKLRSGDRAAIKALMEDLNTRRRDKQPLDMPSAGSVFKRPEGYFAGKLVEDCGLRGFTIGGAQVSCKHCGFIVNAGGATADDILNLIKHIQDTVKTNFGVDMHTEVRIIGEE